MARLGAPCVIAWFALAQAGACGGQAVVDSGAGSGGAATGGTISSAAAGGTNSSGGGGTPGGGGIDTCAGIDEELVKFVSQHEGCTADQDCVNAYGACTRVADYCDGTVYLSREHDGPTWDSLMDRWARCSLADCSTCGAVAPAPMCRGGICGPAPEPDGSCPRDRCVREFSTFECSQAICDACCDECSTEWCDCSIDEHCWTIQRCMEITGCIGEGCYSPAMCRFYIDEAGGPSARASMLALSLDVCIDNTRCRGR